jgi:hypothetical protein
VVFLVAVVLAWMSASSPNKLIANLTHCHHPCYCFPSCMTELSVLVGETVVPN